MEIIKPQVIFLGKKNLMSSVFALKNLGVTCKYFLTFCGKLCIISPSLTKFLRNGYRYGTN